MNHTLENHVMSITVSDHGAELIVFMTKKKNVKFYGRLILHSGTATPRFYSLM